MKSLFIANLSLGYVKANLYKITEELKNAELKKAM